MITQGNIIHFYNKYKENLGTEAQVLEGILKAQDRSLAGKAAAEIQGYAAALH